ncbi:hypothetical protein PUMCH_004386 [Australozyma saopauloensis]|uniref:Uncharacterized protein n=1 Tax=Australozyma saopauloensis TaxID=291208 RepID=A0AAX4HH43_9ASCO|nr:hypothetical protein PUMCH_004386 [[Candida] saopauloensis]
MLNLKHNFLEVTIKLKSNCWNKDIHRLPCAHLRLSHVLPTWNKKAMHKYLFESSRQQNTSQRRAKTSSRREIVFQVPKKRKKSPLSRLSLVPILTSSQTNLSDPLKSSTESASLSVTAKEFYSRPKSYLEQQYEQKISEFVSANGSNDFEALENTTPEESENQLDEFEIPEKIASPENSGFTEEPIPEIPIEPELIREQMVHGDLSIGLLITLSDRFLNTAHAMVFECNDSAGSELYYSYIKLALSSLHKVLSEQEAKLNPQLELAVCLKLARIYFTETENLDLAEKFLSRSQALLSRHHLDKQLLASDLLQYQILSASNDSNMLAYFKDRLSYYHENDMPGACSLFSFLRAQSQIGSEPAVALNHFKLINQDQNCETNISILALILEANLHIYRGNPLEAKPLLKKAAAQMIPLQCQPQIRGLHLLLTLCFYIQVGDFQKGKDTSKEISKFITRQKRVEWKLWKSSGKVAIELELKKGHKILVDFTWINSDMFVIYFYLLSGVLLLSYDFSHAKASEVFMACQKLTDEKLVSVTSVHSSSGGFGINALTEHFVRLNFIRYTLFYYRTWLDIVHNNEFMGIKSIRNFLANFNNENYSGDELIYYKLLRDRFKYLVALYHLHEGDIKAAKYFFTQLRIQNASGKTLKLINASTKQLGIGIGCEILLGRANQNELFLFSSLHLLAISEYEMSSFTLKNLSESDHTKVAEIRSFLGILKNDLNKAIEKDVKFGIGNSEKVLQYTIKLISCAFEKKSALSLGGILELSNDLAEKRVSNYPEFLKAITRFLEYENCTNRDKRKKLKKQILYAESSSTLSSVLKFLIFSKSQSPRGEAVEQDDLELQFLKCKKSLEVMQEKDEFARSSIIL